jgi:protocatechuate 3,4-dioxygenase beta subunit
MFVAAAALVIGCVAIAAADAPGRTLSCSGRVTDPDGKPVAGAAVCLREWSLVRKTFQPDRSAVEDVLAKTTTDDQGNFAFRDVALPEPYLDEISKTTPGPWDVIVRARGYGVAWERVPPQSHRDRVALALAPEAKLEGRVADAKGKPLAGARVQAMRFQGLDQPMQSPATAADNLNLDWSRVVLAAETDAAGRFSLGGLPPSMRVTLTVSHPDCARQTVYAATTDQPQPSVVVGRGRGPTGAMTPREEPVYTGSLTVALQPGHRLRLRAVCGDTGQPAAGAVFRQTSGPGRFEASPVADAAGVLQLDQLAPGRYTFQVALPNRSEYLTAQASVDIPVGRPEVESAVKLPPGCAVTGKVVEEESGRGIAGVNLAYHGAQGGALLAAPTRTRGDGTFRVAVPPGRGWVQIAGEVPGYVTPDPEAPTTGTDLDERFARPVEVAPGQALDNVTLTLSRGLTARVRVLDPVGAPLAGVRVSGAASDAEGKLTLTGLSPYRNHELIATHADRHLAARFTVSPRGERQPVSVEVKLQPTGRVSGRVLGDDQRPIANSYVQLLQHLPAAETKIVFYSAGTSVPTRVEQNGSFTLNGLVPGISYNVNVTAPGHAAAFGANFEGRAGQSQHLPDVILPRADLTISGTVLDPRGRPLPGVQVYGTPVRSGGISHSIRISGGQVFSDAEGRFRLTGIPAGPVRLSAYLAPADEPGGMVRTYAALLVEGGRQGVRLVIAGPDAESRPEAAAGKLAPEFPVRHWLRREGQAGDRAFCRDDFRGRVVLLAFVDEARPSQLLMERLNSLHAQWADKGLTVIRVYEAAQTPAEADATPMPAAIVPPGLVAGGYSEAFQKYGVRATPTLFLIDRQGTLRRADVEPATLEAALGEILK